MTVVERYNPDGAIHQYNGALIVCSWDNPLENGAIKLLPIPVGFWRFMQNPMIWQGWPWKHLNLAKWAVFANETDLPTESVPSWYDAAIGLWKAYGGLVCEPAWHDESRRVIDGRKYDGVSWHCYSGDYRNRSAVLARDGGKPVFGTEYARQHSQSRCFTDLRDIAEQVYLFAWEWPIDAPDPSYTLKGVAQDTDTVDNTASGIVPTPIVLPDNQEKGKIMPQGNVVIQMGHVNIEQNCDHSLQGETGASHAGDGNAERTITETVGKRAAGLLMDAGVGTEAVDANYNCSADRELSHPLVLALHCQSNPPAEGGFDVGTGDPETDGARDESSRLMQNVAAWYEAATGLARRSWCQNNPNVQHYYLFSQLPSATPFALIEMVNTDLDWDWVHTNDHEDRMAYGIANAVLGYLGKPTLTIPSDARKVEPVAQPNTTALSALETAQSALTSAQAAVARAIDSLKA